MSAAERYAYVQGALDVGVIVQSFGDFMVSNAKLTIPENSPAKWIPAALRIRAAREDITRSMTRICERAENREVSVIVVLLASCRWLRGDSEKDIEDYLAGNRAIVEQLNRRK